MAIPEHLQLVTDPGNATYSLYSPIVYVKNTDDSTQVELTQDVVSVTVRRDVDFQQDSYEVIVANGEKWNPEGTQFPGWLLQGQPNLQVIIEAAVASNSVPLTVRVFTGIISVSKGNFTRDKSTWTIGGGNAAELQRYDIGTTGEGTGTLFNLMGTMLQNMGVRNFYLAIPDQFVADPISFLTSTMTGTLQSIMKSMPGLDYYTDPDGHFVTRRPRGDQDFVWDYDSKKNWTAWEPSFASAQGINTVNVNGAGGVAVQIATPKAVTALTTDFNPWGVPTLQQPSPYLGQDYIGTKTYPSSGAPPPSSAATLAEQYGGVRISAINSNLIANEVQAVEAATDLIIRSSRGSLSGVMTLKIPNLLMRPGDLILLHDYARDDGGLGSALDGELLVVRRYTWTWTRSSGSGTMTVGGDRP